LSRLPAVHREDLDERGKQAYDTCAEQGMTYIADMDADNPLASLQAA